MADIRINALATTAASTASDDFIAVDGSANGTRKLSAYSPTFGGNLTVAGTGDSSVAGKLGIATTNPGAALEIGGTNPEIRLGPVSTGSGAYMSYNTAGNYFSLNAVTQGVGYRNLCLASDGGNLGIGTTSPDAKLNVVGSTNGGVGNVYLYDNAANAAGIGGGIAFGGIFTGSTSTPWAIIKGIKDNGDDGNFAGGMVFKTRTASAFGEAMRITSGGNLLLGTTTDAGFKFDVNGTSRVVGVGRFDDNVLLGASSSALNFGGKGFTLYNATAPEIKLIDSYTGGSSTDGSSITLSNADLIITNLESAPIILKTANTTALTLDSSQNATFAGQVTAGTWASGNASKLRVANTTNDWVAYIANTASSGNAYGLRLHTDLTTSGDYLISATSGSGSGSARFAVKANGTINAPSLPTSSAGLSAGDIWNDGGTLKIV